MNLYDFDSYIRSMLAIDAMSGIDNSLNGLQVSRRKQEVTRVACAVDAALDVFQEAAKWKADLLFVHHGLFWGKEQRVTGAHYERIRFLIENDIALYACHLPLDSHLELGNNAGMAQILGLDNCTEFYKYNGQYIGVKGRLPKPLDVHEVSRKIFGDKALAVLPLGPDKINTIGIVSGGAPYAVHDAISEGLDAFITGDASHTVYHSCKEGGINVIFGGHYLSEVWGVKHVANKLNAETDIESAFIDVPTGL